MIQLRKILNSISDEMSEAADWFDMALAPKSSAASTANGPDTPSAGTAEATQRAQTQAGEPAPPAAEPPPAEPQPPAEPPPAEPPRSPQDRRRANRGLFS
jgi:hypothetical protein